MTNEKISHFNAHFNSVHFANFTYNGDKVRKIRISEKTLVWCTYSASSSLMGPGVWCTYCASSSRVGYWNLTLSTYCASSSRVGSWNLMYLLCYLLSGGVLEPDVLTVLPPLWWGPGTWCTYCASSSRVGYWSLTLSTYCASSSRVGSWNLMYLLC